MLQRKMRRFHKPKQKTGEYNRVKLHAITCFVKPQAVSNGRKWLKGVLQDLIGCLLKVNEFYAWSFLIREVAAWPKEVSGRFQCSPKISARWQIPTSNQKTATGNFYFWRLSQALYSIHKQTTLFSGKPNSTVD